MKRKYFSWKIIICWLSALVLINCKTPYEPKLKSSDTNVLVVEGYIDGAVPVNITLSRSRMISNGDTATRRYETGARVQIEDDHQNIYSLMEVGHGVYTSNYVLSLNTSFQYRLHIFTSDNKEYLSDFVPFKVSPPIDTVAWTIKDGGLQTLLNTHDPNNATRYYRWEYSETWEFHSWDYSVLQYNPTTNKVVNRTVPVFVCWQSDNSTNIYLGSSAKLTNDVITETPLAYIPPHDNKLSVLYSIWVKQYALDINGYNYWVAMKNNTENVGSIFDPQPNETVGNIHCVTNPSETVVGYISAGNSVTNRTFISNSSIPPGWNQYPDCPMITVPDIPDSLKFYFGGGGYEPIDLASPPATGYMGSYSTCVDCTLSGTTIKPSFWP